VLPAAFALAPCSISGGDEGGTFATGSFSICWFRRTVPCDDGNPSPHSRIPPDLAPVCQVSGEPRIAKLANLVHSLDEILVCTAILGESINPSIQSQIVCSTHSILRGSRALYSMVAVA
jgi:hypothetical protein